MSDKRDIDVFLFNEKIVCDDCKKQIKIHDKTYLIDGIEWYVLYEYNEYLERLFFQYKEQRDVVLKDLFLNDVKLSFSKYCVCALCSSEEKRFFRGFEPIIDIFSGHNVCVYSPFYKKENVKQSSLSGRDREKIGEVLALKSLYPLPKKKIMVVDDVCTTGSTLRTAIALLHPSFVFVLAAHSIWIKEHQGCEIVSSKKKLVLVK